MSPIHQTTTLRSAPGEPRPCRNSECRALFTPGKAGGYGEHCGRCNKAQADGREHGPRIRQPRGKAKRLVKSYVLPELDDLLTPVLLAQYGLTRKGEIMVLAVARLLGREDLGPAKVSRGSR